MTLLIGQDFSCRHARTTVESSRFPTDRVLHGQVECDITHSSRKVILEITAHTRLVPRDATIRVVLTLLIVLITIHHSAPF